jgi:hypothetical protein
MKISRKPTPPPRPAAPSRFIQPFVWVDWPSVTPQNHRPHAHRVGVPRAPAKEDGAVAIVTATGIYGSADNYARLQRPPFGMTSARNAACVHVHRG